MGDEVGCDSFRKVQIEEGNSENVKAAHVGHFRAGREKVREKESSLGES